MIALTHAVGAALADCELTFVARRPIDVARAARQHAAYCDLLRGCGAEVRTVATSPSCPDAVFVEDAAVVLDEVAVATSMGTASRRPEVDGLLPALRALRRVERIVPPATLEGGDVLRIGRVLYVGVSARTNRAGIEALAAIAVPLGYRIVPVEVEGCLHLKTACTALDATLLLANASWVDTAPFAGMRVVEVDAAEPFGANTLRLGGLVCASASHPRTNAKLAALGFELRTADISELEKAEAGMTCLSLLFT